MSGQELAPAGLAKRINEEHAACERAAQTAIEHAFRAGALLAEAKAGIPHGEWLPWVREHLSCSPRTAQGYMRLADNRERLTNAQRASHLSVRTALHLLAEPKDAEPEQLQDNQGRVSIAAIDIGQRIREELGDIEGLAKSIESIGLLEPIGIEEAAPRPGR